jgi:hypothetical protein
MIESGNEEQRSAAEGIIKTIIKESGAAKHEMRLAHEVMVKIQSEADRLKNDICAIKKTWNRWLSFRASSPEYADLFIELSKQIDEAGNV